MLLDAMYRDTPVMWCPHIYVDNDAALARGGRKAFPRRWAAFFKRAHICGGKPCRCTIVPGGRFGASLSAHGQRLAEALHHPAKPVENGLSPSAARRSCCDISEACRRISGQAGGQRGDVDHRKCNRRRRMVGEGELNIPDAQGEELHALAPSRIASGFRYSLAYSVTDLKILEDHTRK